jgi:hypothetical protein
MFNIMINSSKINQKHPQTLNGALEPCPRAIEEQPNMFYTGRETISKVSERICW